MVTNLSDTQRECLRRMATGCGEICRLRGGFWSTPEVCAGRDWRELRAPAWWVGVSTVRALEKRGLVERIDPSKPDWLASRWITLAGRQALSNL